MASDDEGTKRIPLDQLMPPSPERRIHEQLLELSQRQARALERIAASLELVAGIVTSTLANPLDKVTIEPPPPDVDE
jgi:hypothetical protein